MQDLPDPIKHAGDGLSIATTAGALFGILPEISALLSVVWLAIRIWETRTVQGLLKKPACGGDGED